MACNACGDKWYNTADDKFYSDSDCLSLTTGTCSTQSDYPCVCSGCTHVGISPSFPATGQYNCSNDPGMCTADCTSVPELSGPSLLAPLIAIGFFLFFNWKSKQKNAKHVT